MRIATGQIEDTTTEDGKNAAAVALGRMGGKDYSVRFAVARLFRESGLIVATISAYSGEWRQLSDAIAAPSTNALKQSS
jgi:hypothetical protein